MNFTEIKKMAKGMGINTYGMKKIEVIRSIQRAENNIDCYGTDRVEICNEDACLWRDDCLSLNVLKQAHHDPVNADCEKAVESLPVGPGDAHGDAFAKPPAPLVLAEARQRPKTAEYVTRLPDPVKGMFKNLQMLPVQETRIQRNFSGIREPDTGSAGKRKEEVQL